MVCSRFISNKNACYRRSSVPNHHLEYKRCRFEEFGIVLLQMRCREEGESRHLDV